jgi:hypothetical protein
MPSSPSDSRQTRHLSFRRDGEYRADDRFPFCSTFKALEAGAVLIAAGPADKHAGDIP